MASLRLIGSMMGSLVLAALAVACAPASEDDSVSNEANLDQSDTPPPSGPLKLDATFATNGKLTLAGGGHAVSAARRADGGLAVIRNRTNEVALTIVTPDGATSSDVLLPGASSVRSARALQQKDATLVVGQNGGRYYAARIDAKGAIDPTFMPDPLDFVPTDSAVDGQGRIFLAGTFQNHAAVVRLLPNGGVDASFAQQGAWLASDDKTNATKVVVTSDGIAVVAASTSSTAVIHFNGAGVMGHSAVLPLNKGDVSRTALIANQDGSLTYIGPKENDLTLHQYTIAPSGLVATGAAIDGELVDATQTGVVSAKSTDIGCTVHVGAATASLSAFECSAGLDYVALGGGKRAIVVNSGISVYVQVFAN